MLPSIKDLNTVAQQMVSTAVECRDTGGNPRSNFGCVCVRSRKDFHLDCVEPCCSF